MNRNARLQNSLVKDEYNDRFMERYIRFRTTLVGMRAKVEVKNDFRFNASIAYVAIQNGRDTMTATVTIPDNQKRDKRLARSTADLAINQFAEYFIEQIKGNLAFNEITPSDIYHNPDRNTIEVRVSQMSAGNEYTVRRVLNLATIFAAREQAIVLGGFVEAIKESVNGMTEFMLSDQAFDLRKHGRADV